MKLIDKIRAYLTTQPDPCPNGGDHDWDMVYMEWENIPIYYCSKCHEMEFA